MSRRLRLPLVVGLTFVALAGCDATTRPWQRKAKEPASIYLDEPTEDPSFARPEEARGFFKSNRNFGGWSSEAREIEKSFGVVR